MPLHVVMALRGEKSESAKDFNLLVFCAYLTSK
ncbi:hypothetical protein CFELI_03335 [Corynebacterium felinum]|uniref:Uncharacterized protein n=1 Tax=Corynebacterium felinum TaxID=131318 RepID=A0ABU2B996_9CORY|nr:hypothetical protein [Corynebacterium felinum]WJY94309.1 hypothetical protein CFELI_03335 [Corynebacterium felinum]